MKKELPKNWDADFREFIDSAETRPPQTLSEHLVGRIVAELNPSPVLVFTKVLMVTFLSGSVSLVVCPQFGFGNNMGLMRFFMELGPHFCSFACGAVFLGVGALASAFVLRPEEMRVLRRTKYLQIVAAAGASLSLFVCAGASVVLVAATLWILGATIAGVIFFEVSYRYRFAPIA